MYALGMDAAVETLVEDLKALPDFDDTASLRDLLAFQDLVAARVNAIIDAVDRSGAVGVDGAVTTAGWLRRFARRTYRDAAAVVRRATRLRDCPAVTTAWTAGELSTGQIDVIVATVTDRTATLFTDHAPDVVPTLVGLSVRDTERVMRYWANHADALIDPPPPPGRARSLHLSPGLDGTGQLNGHLDAASHDIVKAALDNATTDDVDGEPARTASERRADALTEICRYYLDHPNTDATTRRRPHVQVVLTLADLERGTGTSVDGDPVDASTIAALLCDAAIHRYITNGQSVTLDAGRATRTVNHHLYTALALRDQGCRFPGCDRPVTHCEAHHAIPWQHGGTTTQDNLVLLCWRHHHDFAHHPQWQLKLLPDATVEITTPEGRVLVSRPPPPTTFAAVGRPLPAA